MILTSASTRVDGSLSLRFSSPELRPDEKTAFFELLNVNLKMLLQPVDGEPVELKEVKGLLDEKTPSQRMRGCLYVLYRQKCPPGKTFDSFYLDNMNRLIEDIKSQLEPEPT